MRRFPFFFFPKHPTGLDRRGVSLPRSPLFPCADPAYGTRPVEEELLFPRNRTGLDAYRALKGRGVDFPTEKNVAHPLHGRIEKPKSKERPLRSEISTSFHRLYPPSALVRDSGVLVAGWLAD